MEFESVMRLAGGKGGRNEIIFTLELHAPAIIEGNERGDALPAAVFVDGHNIVGWVKEQLGDFLLR